MLDGNDLYPAPNKNIVWDKKDTFFMPLPILIKFSELYLTA